MDHDIAKQYIMPIVKFETTRVISARHENVLPFDELLMAYNLGRRHDDISPKILECMSRSLTIDNCLEMAILRMRMSTIH